MPQLVNCQPGDAIIAGQFYRAIFETRALMAPARVVYELAGGDVGQELYQELRAGRQIDYITPINDSEGVAGDHVWVFDLRTFANRETVAQLVNRLDTVTPYTALRSLARVLEADVYGAPAIAERAGEQQASQAKHDDESLTHKLATVLKDAGVVVVIILIIAGLIIAHKAYREYAA